MAIIIDGKQIAADLREKLKSDVAELKAKGVNPGMAVIMVGEDPAAAVYVKNRGRDCEELGFVNKEYILKEDTSQEELLQVLNSVNNDKEIHGILIQLPLPKHIDEEIILKSIAPEKDVDVFHPENVGRIMIGDYDYATCTPSAVMELIKASGIDPTGKHCVVIGRSNIVGKPVAMLMLQANATVTICHSKTKDLAQVCSSADILISAIGKPKFVTADMVKEGAVVIDVGINRDENNKLCGDVDYANVKDKTSYITPVPGGVGPMTRVALLKNTLKAASKGL